MIRPFKFSDTAVFQRSDYTYFRNLKKQHIRFNFVKLTEGTSYTSPSAYAQIRNSLKVFGSVGVYHYWHGETPDYFLSEFKKTGRDPKTTKFALDVEETSLPYYLAGYINSFFKRLVAYGFKPGNLWVYTNVTKFLRNSRIIVSHLKYGFVWGAYYASMDQYYNESLRPSSRFQPHLNAWQFNGTGQDLSFDYTGTLVSNEEPKRKPANRYLKDGRLFKAVSNNNGYDDLKFRVKNQNVLAKGSIIKGTPVKFGGITRLKTSAGYFSTNTKYLAKIK